jgi:hypothetical protein
MIYQGRQWLDTEGLEGEGRISYKRGLACAIEAFRETLERAASCPNRNFHTLFLYPLLPPQSPVIRSFVARGKVCFPTHCHHIVMLSTPKSALLMDKAYSDSKTRGLARFLNFRPVVPPKKDRTEPWRFDQEDKEVYKQRNGIELAFRRIFTR